MQSRSKQETKQKQIIIILKVELTAAKKPAKDKSAVSQSRNKKRLKRRKDKRF
jgi:hypothetical protein